jgi:hypothetical protein
MTRITDFNEAQAEEMRHLTAMWPEYGHSLQVAAATSGGMGWKIVKGVEYLVRYLSEEGKKKFTSYGRRNEKTEEMYRRFEETTGRAREIIREERDEVALHCRLAKAHGLARLPGRQAETLEWCWYLDITARLSLFGGAALLAYEGHAGALAPAPLVKEDFLQFVARTSDVEALGLDEIAEACDVDKTGCAVRRRRDRIEINTTDGEPRAEILLPQFFLSRAGDDHETEMMAAALELPRWKGLTIARDCRPIALTAVDPKAYVLLARAFGDDGVWPDRAAVAAQLGARIDPDFQDPAADGPALRGP